MRRSAMIGAGFFFFFFFFFWWAAALDGFGTPNPPGIYALHILPAPLLP